MQNNVSASQSRWRWEVIAALVIVAIAGTSAVSAQSGGGPSGLETVTAELPLTSEDTMTVAAVCPPSKVVIGGGAEVFGDAGIWGKVALGRNMPGGWVDGLPTEWHAGAREIESTPTDLNWSLRAVAICANRP